MTVTSDSGASLGNSAFGAFPLRGAGDGLPFKFFSLILASTDSSGFAAMPTARLFPSSPDDEALLEGGAGLESSVVEVRRAVEDFVSLKNEVRLVDACALLLSSVAEAELRGDGAGVVLLSSVAETELRRAGEAVSAPWTMVGDSGLAGAVVEARRMGGSGMAL